ncbi:MAG: ATP-binding protein [Cyanobacteria bacterium P01_D01_bin.56]
MARLFDLNFYEPDDRRWLAQQTGLVLRTVYTATPKRALVLYGALLLGLLLWFVPVRYKFRPWLSLTFTTLAATIVAGAQTGLERWQDEIDAFEEDATYQQALHRTAVEAVHTTQQYAKVQAARLEATEGLPHYLLEEDLVDPVIAEQAEFREFKRMMGVKDTDASIEEIPNALLAGDSNGDGLAPQPKGTLKFSRVYNKKKRKKELHVDLTGHSHYAGVPIVNLAQEMATESRGCIGVGPTGTGKSTLLRHAIAAQYAIDESTDFTVIEHKASNRAKGETHNFCGLEQSKDFYELSASMNGPDLAGAARQFYRRLYALQGVMSRGSLVPSVVIIDQINQGLKAASKAGSYASRQEEEQGYPVELDAIYKDDVASFLVDGRELGLKAWVFGHANTNEALGLEHQIKENVFYIGLGRDGNYSAVLNPLKGDRFIALKEDRTRLAEQLQEYLKAHAEYGSPVNVVLTITSCGGQGWRLVVLPQLPEPEPIHLGVTNPPASTRYQPPKTSPPVASDPQPDAETSAVHSQDLDAEAMRQALEQRLNPKAQFTQYTSEHKQIALTFVKWVKQHRHDYIDAQGLLDPETVAAAFVGVTSTEQMELILQLITDLGYGNFERHPHTGSTAWRLKGELPVGSNTPAGPTRPIVSEATEPDLEPLPAQITEAKFNAILGYLSQKQIGIRLKPNEFLTGCHDLIRKDSPTKCSTKDVRLVLFYLHQKGIVDFPNLEAQQFQLIGFPFLPGEDAPS